jgi:RHS repeat-associated protein
MPWTALTRLWTRVFSGTSVEASLKAFTSTIRSVAEKGCIFALTARRALHLRLRPIVIALIAYTAIPVAIANCQGQPGILPFSTNEFGVDIATGNVNVSFPLRSKTGKIPFWSTIVGTSGMAVSSAWYPQLVWSYQDPTVATVGSGDSPDTVAPCYVSPQRYSYAEYLEGFSITDSSGALHPFPGKYKVGQGTPGSPCASQTDPLGPVQTTDNSGYTMTITNGTITILDKEGNTRTGTCSYANNGCELNHVLTDPDGATISTSTDSLGTTVLSGAPYSGLMAPSSAASYLDANGATQQYVFGYTTLNLQSNFNCITTSGVQQPQDFGPQVGENWAKSMLTSITLPGPNPAQYTITYEPTPGISGSFTGRIASISLPSGGSISYAYSGGNQGINCAYNTVPTLTVTVNDNNGNSGTYTYVSSLSTSASNASGVGYLPASTFTVTKTDPLNNQTVYTFFHEFQTQVQYYQGSTNGTLLKTVTTCYNNNLLNCANPSSSPTLPFTQIDTYTSLGSSGNSLVEQTFDAYGNVSSEKDMDYGNVGSGGQCITATAGVCTLTVTTYGSWSGSGCTALSTIFAVPCDVKIENNNTGAILAETRYTYNSTGHPTAISKWASGSNWLTTGYSYNTNGTLASMADPAGNVTTYGYAATGSGGCNGLLLTSTTYALTSAGSSSQTWNCNGGVLANNTDVNGQTTTYTYSDALWRLTGTAYPDGGSTTTTYSTGATTPWTTSVSSSMSSSSSMTNLMQFDGLGRSTKTQLASGASVYTSYDGLGRIHTASNPYSSPSDPTYGMTTYTYDALNRKTLEVESDGSQLQWSYPGNCVIFTDEALNPWTRCADALGRLTSVMEPGGRPTAYSYDALSNLLNVTQTGVGNETPRIRSFFYDSLSRLTSSANPETGTISYGYGANGNMNYKTDARGITTNYSYDALNRLTDKTFSDGQTPGQHFRYDQTSNWMGAQSNTIGRLSEAYTDQDLRYYGGGSQPACNPLSSSTANYNPAYGDPVYCEYTDELYSYDAMGRQIRIGTAFPSEVGWSAHGTSVTYDLAGNITSLTYPDGRVVTQGWNSAGLLQSSTFSTWNSTSVGYSYLTSASYWPDGSPNTMTFGNGITQTINKNPRLQVTEISFLPSASGLSQTIFDKQYNFTSSCQSANNGNIMQVIDTLNNNQSQAFCYDQLNRISAFSNGDGSMQQSYTIDSFGNMSQSGTLNSSLSFGTNNQINSSGYGYDAAGNLNSFYNGISTSTYSFDAESKLFNLNAGGGYYTYDAAGERMRKDTGGSFTEYQYLNGQPIAEKNADGTWNDYIYANGKKIAMANNFDVRIHVHGTFDATNEAAVWTISYAPYAVRNGDHICWRQSSSAPGGGLGINFTNGASTGGVAYDQDGDLTDSDSAPWGWHNRCVDLSPNAGLTIGAIWIGNNNSAPAGTWDILFGDISITSSNGTVTPIYWRNTSVGLGSPWTNQPGPTNLQAYAETTNPSSDMLQPDGTTTYYLGDQIGSTRQMIAAGGWPVSSDTFYPFGQEQNPTTDANHYRFTGKERDSESGNDYFGARYYASNMGRFMSPDPVGPWAADVSDPQSWNFYNYARNNPLINVDPTGLDCVHINNDTGAYEGFESGDCDNSTTEKANSGYYVDGTVSNISVNGQGQVTGYDANTSSGMFDSYAGSMNPSATAANLNPYTNALSAPGQSVTVNGNPMPGLDPSLDLLSNVMFSKAIQHNNPNPGKGAQPVRGKDGKITGWTLPGKGNKTGQRVPKTLQWGRENGLNPDDPRWTKMAVGVGAAAAGGLTVMQILEYGAAGALVF